ncbi:phage protein Gp36 family protein [Kaistia sp. MMO-174]|uniref:phage protein Gp36 family protein n=1 Tax=Kaistia sp. MMO-174 TaxID=3081256 RepID=UPI003015B0D9
MTAFATLAQVIARYPSEATILAADETTRLRDDARIEAALGDASAEIRSILFARYTEAELGRVTPASAEVLQLYCIDMALYRVALSFGRSNERVKERYEAAIARLTAIAIGKGALSIEGSASSGGDGPDGAAGSGSPNEALVVGPERVLTRDRLVGW